jgi:hypothetical protein
VVAHKSKAHLRRQAEACLQQALAAPKPILDLEQIATHFPVTTASLPNHTTLRINADACKPISRPWQRFATPQGGVHRPTFSDAHLEARRWLRQRLLEAELEFHQDGAGNHSGRLACGPSQAASLLLGSHLDSVPDGGRFDGALGVVVALEALRVVKESHIQLPVNLEVVDFTDEEGTLFGLLAAVH